MTRKRTDFIADVTPFDQVEGHPIECDDSTGKGNVVL